jgi:nucleoid DNA-binding protein
MGQRMARESKLTEEQVTRVLNALGPAVRDELTKGNTVNLPGLGILRVVRVAEHKDMEAGTARLLRIPAKNTVEFLATDGLGEAANSATAVPAETVPAFDYTPLPNQTKGRKVPYQKVEGTLIR